MPVCNRACDFRPRPRPASSRRSAAEGAAGRTVAEEEEHTVHAPALRPARRSALQRSRITVSGGRRAPAGDSVRRSAAAVSAAPVMRRMTARQGAGATPVNALGLLHLAAVAAAAILETATAATNDKACRTAPAAQSRHSAAACVASVAAPNGQGPPHAGGRRTRQLRPNSPTYWTIGRQRDTVNP